MAVIRTITSIFRGRHRAAANANSSSDLGEPVIPPMPDAKPAADRSATTVISAPELAGQNNSSIETDDHSSGATALVPPRRKTSARKTEANRQNAKRSTGPKTQHGKLVVRQNALKHGLYTNVVVTKGDGSESVAEYETLSSRLCCDLEPVGVLEEEQVATIAKLIWRTRRVERYESGQILLKTGTVKVNAELAQADQLATWRSNPELFNTELRQTPMGNRLLITILMDAERELRSGELSQSTYNIVVEFFGENKFLTDYTEARWDEPSVDEDGDDRDEEGGEEENSPALDLNIARAALLKWVGEYIQHLTIARAVLEEKNNLEVEAVVAASCSPDAPYEVLRLERTLDKRIRSASERLQELQNARKKREVTQRCSASEYGQVLEGGLDEEQAR